jgi:hypothetical protein
MAEHSDSPIAVRLWNIRIDAAIAEVVAALARRGIFSVVLKGPALRDWYGADEEAYSDGDLWVAPDQFVPATTELRMLGFVPDVDERGLPEWWLEHAAGFHRARDGAQIDLHRRLPGVGVSPARAWHLLSRRTEPFMVGGIRAARLRSSDRALQVTLHALHHGVAEQRPLRHVAAAIRALSMADWRAASQAARELTAAEGLAAGLELLPEGRALARQLALPPVCSASVRLQVDSAPSAALTLQDMAEASLPRRLAMIARKLFPPPGYMRHWWPPAQRGWRMLLLAYLYRPFWVLQRLPDGYRARRAAARRSSSSR